MEINLFLGFFIVFKMRDFGNEFGIEKVFYVEENKNS